MTQYSALAGRPPFNFLCLPYGSGASSVLLLGEDLGIEYTDMNAFLAELRRFIEDPAYRHAKEAAFRAKKLIVTEEEFVGNLKKILCENQSNYPVPYLTWICGFRKCNMHRCGSGGSEIR